MSKTTELIDALDHTKNMLYQYIRNIENSGYSNYDHSAAQRATLDLSRKLSGWRHEPTSYRKIK